MKPDLGDAHVLVADRVSFVGVEVEEVLLAERAQDRRARVADRARRRRIDADHPRLVADHRHRMRHAHARERAAEIAGALRLEHRLGFEAKVKRLRQFLQRTFVSRRVLP